MRKVYKTSDVKVKDLRNGACLKKLYDDDSAFKFMASVPLSPAYAQSKGQHAKAMMRQIGKPTMFFTISMAENRSPELIAQLYRNKNPHLPKLSLIDALNLSDDEKTKLIRDDPVLCCTFFKNRSNEFIKYCKNPNGPFGENYAEEHLRRTECQMRGTPHVHGMFYLKDVPVYDYKSDVAQ